MIFILFAKACKIIQALPFGVSLPELLGEGDAPEGGGRATFPDFSPTNTNYFCILFSSQFYWESCFAI